METSNGMPVEDRVIRLMDQLAIDSAHFAARAPNDLKGLVARYPERISSLSLVCPQDINIEHFSAVSSRLLVFNGDKGSISAQVSKSLSALPNCTVETLSDYFAPGWADIVSDRTDQIGNGLLSFVGASNKESSADVNGSEPSEGEIAGITYQIRGEGIPLFLLPLMHAPSQWQPLIAKLSEQLCTITLGGSHLGSAANLESRGRSSGYLGMQRNLFEEMGIAPGEVVLEVGCGTGVLDRWLANYTGGANKIIGSDLNLLNLREAATLSKNEGLDDIIEFKVGNAEDLPFSDESFDITFSSTVMEQVHADRMLSEMIRVTKPGGRVGVIVRAEDMPGWINLRIDSDLKSRMESRLGGRNVSEHGCADSSLYERFERSQLNRTKLFPWLAVSDVKEHLTVQLDRLMSALEPAEAAEVQRSLQRTEAQGVFILAQPYHCAIGTK